MNDETINKGIVTLLVAAIVVSVGSTLISLDRLSAIGGITGFATVQQGTVIFNVNETLSITLLENTVDFGECILNISTGGIIQYDSDVVYGNLNNAYNCTGLSTGDEYMLLENSGNIDASINISAAKTGSAFIEASSTRGSLFFKGKDDKVGSCASDLQDSFMNFSTTDHYLLCSNLTSHATANTMRIYYRLILPGDTPAGEKSNTITFTASNA
ncbi:MAG TPA: hypothetical protein ENN46_02410 [Candidatus Woesearchaeota archaeon]|nr:hypothetical protein [Candidatus Woesearchaeota archaeon]